MRRSLIVRTLAVAAGACLALSACGGGGNPLANNGSGPASSGSAASTSIVVGSANFSKDPAPAEIYAQALQAKGVNV
jgi:osmoprotectant transport system substrate-binding protein